MTTEITASCFALTLLASLARQDTALATALEAIPAVDLGELWPIELDERDRSLGRASWVAIGPDDRIFAVSESDRSMHAFDETGRLQKVVPYGEPPEDSFPRLTWRGGWWLEEQSWLQPGTDRRWSLSPWSLCLSESDGRVVRGFDADFDELRQLLALDVAADGSACVVAASRAGRAIMLCAPDGELRSTWYAPPQLHYTGASSDGSTLAIVLQDYVVVFDDRFAPRFRAPIGRARWPACPSGEPDLTWRVHLARGGTEVWVRRGPAATRIDRYRMP